MDQIGLSSNHRLEYSDNFRQDFFGFERYPELRIDLHTLECDKVVPIIKEFKTHPKLYTLLGNRFGFADGESCATASYLCLEAGGFLGLLGPHHRMLSRHSIAAPTLTFTQTMLLGGATGLSMSTTQALITGDNVLKRALEGGVLGAAAAGVNFKLGTTAQTFKGQAIQAATSASLHTAFHGGNLGQNIVMAVAANTVAHAVLPMDKVHLDGKSLTEVSLRTAGHASVMAATAVAFHSSPGARANIVIAAVGGMITPIAESAGQGVGEQVIAHRVHREQTQQAIVFKQEPKEGRENASEAIKARGVHVPTKTIKPKLQQHYGLKGTPQEVQQRFIEIGQNERSRATALDILIPAVHASEIGTSESSKAMLPMYNRAQGVQIDMRVSSSLKFDSREHLNVGVYETIFVSVGGCLDKCEKGLWQLGLIAGEKLGFMPRGSTQYYTPFINEELAFYAATPVAMSKLGRATETVTDIGLGLLIPGGAGLRGGKLLLSSSAVGGVLSGIQVTPDGLLSTRLENAALGAATTAVATYTLGVIGGAVVAEGKSLHYAYTLHKKGDIHHVFSTVKGQPKPGHLTDTMLNRHIIARTYLKKENFLGKEQWGNEWYAKLRSDGRQAWSKWNDGRLISGGLNPTPIEFHPLSGLSKPKPRK